LAFEFDLAGELDPLNMPVLPLLRVFWALRLVELFDRLLAFGFVAGLEGVGGGDARGTVGSGGWPLLRSRASISSGDRFTFVLPFALARAILSIALWINCSSLSLTAV
jgi:hypothetical protein